MLLKRSEVRSGLVLFMDPNVLVDEGAVLGGFGRPIDTPHYFICIATDGSTSSWVAASSHNGPCRLPVTRKSGHPGWVGRATFVVPFHVWTAPFEAVALASAGVDFSVPGLRNLAAVDWTPALAAAA